MLFDLTRVSGQRVDQVDELQLAGRHWVRSTDVFIALGGAVVGALVGQGIRTFIGGGYIPYFLIPPSPRSSCSAASAPSRAR